MAASSSTAASSRSSRPSRPAPSTWASPSFSGRHRAASIDGELSWALTNDIYELAATYGFADSGEAPWLQPVAWIPLPHHLPRPDRALRLGAVSPLGHRPRPLRRGLGRGCGLHVGHARRPLEDRRLHRRRPVRRARRPLPHAADLVRQCRRPPGRRLHAELDRRRGHRRDLAPGWRRQRYRVDLRRARHPLDLVQLSHLQRRPAAPAADRRDRCCCAAVSIGAARVFQVKNKLELFR